MPDDPAEPKLKLGGESLAGVPVEVLIEIIQAALRVNGQPAGAPIVFADRLNAESIFWPEASPLAVIPFVRRTQPRTIGYNPARSPFRNPAPRGGSAVPA